MAGKRVLLLDGTCFPETIQNLYKSRELNSVTREGGPEFNCKDLGHMSLKFSEPHFLHKSGEAQA